MSNENLRSFPALTCSLSGANLTHQVSSSWEEQKKTVTIRRAYQQAVQIPLGNVKRLWEEYQEFENKLDRITVCGPLHHVFPYVLTLLR